MRAEDAVIKHALHAVAVAAVAGNSSEIAGDFEMRVGAAGRFKTGMGFGQALADLAAAGSAKVFIRSPAAGGEALGGAEKLKAVARRAKVFLRRRD